MLNSPSHTRSGKVFSAPPPSLAIMPEISPSGPSGSRPVASPTPPPHGASSVPLAPDQTNTLPPTSPANPVSHVLVPPTSASSNSFLNSDLVPLWTGDDPSYSIFTFIRRIEDAVAHSSLTDAEKIAFLRACMSCDARTPAGAALDDDFYTTCGDFKEFCHQLIKEFACSDNDPCLASFSNLSDLIRSNSGTLDPRDAAAVTGRFRTELSHSLSHSQWLDSQRKISESDLLSLLSYHLYTNLLKPHAAQLTKDITFLPSTSIHDLKVSVESKLRSQSYVTVAKSPPLLPSCCPPSQTCIFFFSCSIAWCKPKSYIQ